MKLREALKKGLTDPYFWQLNIYKTYCLQSAKKLTLALLVKDWSNRIGMKDSIDEIEYIDVPIMPEPFIRDFVEGRVKLAMDMLHNGFPIPPCPEEETKWRCAGYCSVNSVCPQFAATCKEKGRERA